VQPTCDVDAMTTKMRNLLHTAVVSKAIQKLQDDPHLAEWVRKGKDIHTGKEVCEFCGNRLPPDLITRLNDHFSDKYDRHVRTLSTTASELESATISVPFIDEAVSVSLRISVAVMDLSKRAISG